MDISYKWGLGWPPDEPLLQLSFPGLPSEWVGVWPPLGCSVLAKLPREWPWSRIGGDLGESGANTSGMGLS